jgi:hypothetical protein
MIIRRPLGLLHPVQNVIAFTDVNIIQGLDACGLNWHSYPSG